MFKQRSMSYLENTKTIETNQAPELELQLRKGTISQSDYEYFYQMKYLIDFSSYSIE
jgi:hypothetical protein